MAALQLTVSDFCSSWFIDEETGYPMTRKPYLSIGCIGGTEYGLVDEPGVGMTILLTSDQVCEAVRYGASWDQLGLDIEALEDFVMDLIYECSVSLDNYPIAYPAFSD